jgi:hypothetical protein
LVFVSAVMIRENSARDGARGGTVEIIVIGAGFVLGKWCSGENLLPEITGAAGRATFRESRGQKAEGRRQKAQGTRHKAEGRKHKAESTRQKAQGTRQQNAAESV